ncbi:hypothetical protein BDQ17DRAFT_1422761 [Cyathus striatus]|nr:hypothetical protein BDQ17DRAFT_1422761 [Cyathus striatus]
MAVPEPPNATSSHPKLRLSLHLADKTFLSGTYVSGKLETESKADVSSGLGLGSIMVEVFGVQELNSRDHTATSLILHAQRYFQGPGLPPSNAVLLTPQDSTGMPEGYNPARRGTASFLFRIPLPPSLPNSIEFAGAARTRYELRASVNVWWRGERRVVLCRREVEIVEEPKDEQEREERVAVGEGGKVSVSGRVWGYEDTGEGREGVLVPGRTGCVELFVRNHSSKKTSSLTLTLIRTLHLPSSPSEKRNDTVLLQDTPLSVPYHGAEYLVPPGVEGVAQLAFDVPDYVRGESGGIVAEGVRGTKEGLFELSVVVRINVGVGRGKDIALELPVRVVHPLALPLLPSPTHYGSPQGYLGVPQGYVSPPFPASPGPQHLSLAPPGHALPAQHTGQLPFQPWTRDGRSPSPGVYRALSPDRALSPLGRAVSPLGRAMSPYGRRPLPVPGAATGGMRSPSPGVFGRPLPVPGRTGATSPYAGSPIGSPPLPMSPIVTRGGNLWLPPPSPAIPVRAYSPAPLLSAPVQVTAIARPVSAGPTPGISGLPLPLPPKTKAQQLPLASPWSTPDSKREEGKGERALRVSKHLKMSSRNRSVSPLSHRWGSNVEEEEKRNLHVPPMLVPGRPESRQAISRAPSPAPSVTFEDKPVALGIPPELDPEIQHQQLVKPGVLHSPRPHLTTKRSFVNEKDDKGKSRSVARSDRVLELEKIADDVTRRVSDLSGDLPVEKDDAARSVRLVSNVKLADKTNRGEMSVQELLKEEDQRKVDVNKSLPGPPLPRRGRPRQRTFPLVSPDPPVPVPVPSDQTPPTPTLVAHRPRIRPELNLNLNLPQESGLDALERRLLKEVGTRKLEENGRLDVRDVFGGKEQGKPIDIPCKSPEPLNDSAISSLTLANGDAGFGGMDERDERALIPPPSPFEDVVEEDMRGRMGKSRERDIFIPDFDEDHDSSDVKTHRAGGKSKSSRSSIKSIKVKERGRSRKKAKSDKGRSSEKKRDRDPHKEVELKKSRVTAWLGGIDLAAPPPNEDFIPPSPIVDRDLRVDREEREPKKSRVATWLGGIKPAATPPKEDNTPPSSSRDRDLPKNVEVKNSRLTAWLGGVDHAALPPAEDVIPPSPSVVNHSKDALGDGLSALERALSGINLGADGSPRNDRVLSNGGKTPLGTKQQEEEVVEPPVPNPRSSGFVPVGTFKRNGIAKGMTVAEEARKVADLWSEDLVSPTPTAQARVTTHVTQDKNTPLHLPSPKDSLAVALEPPVLSIKTDRRVSPLSNKPPPGTNHDRQRPKKDDPPSKSVKPIPPPTSTKPPQPYGGASRVPDFSLRPRQDPEAKYDIRSARGGRGGKVAAVASIWAAAAATAESSKPKEKEDLKGSNGVSGVVNGVSATKALDRAGVAPASSDAMLRSAETRGPSTSEDKPNMRLPTNKQTGALPKAMVPTPIARVAGNASIPKAKDISERSPTKDPSPPEKPARLQGKLLINNTSNPALAEPKLLDLSGKRTKPMSKSPSVPAIVSSSHAIPMLSSTASLARTSPVVSPTKVDRIKVLPDLIAPRREVEQKVSPRPASPPKLAAPVGELAFGKARLRDLIKKYQEQGT